MEKFAESKSKEWERSCRATHDMYFLGVDDHFLATYNIKWLREEIFKPVARPILQQYLLMKQPPKN